MVFEDAALDQAVEGIVNGIFFNQGHVCCAGSRLLIQESVADVVIGKLWERMGRLRIGDPLDKNTDVGAINSCEQLERIEALVAEGEGEGAVRRSVACDLPERGWWFAPTIFTEVAPAHRIAVEEIFGPVVSVLTFRTQAEAIEKANNSAYGLAAGIWTDKGAKAFEVARRCRPAWCGRTPTTTSTRRRPSAATRRAASGARAVRPGCGPTCGWSHDPARGSQDLQAVRGRRVRALGVRALRPRGGPQRAARLAKGRARRRAGRAGGRRAVGGAHGVQPRADPLPGR